MHASADFPSPLVIYDRGHRSRIETGPAHQSAVDIGPFHQALDVIRLDAAAVKDPQTFGRRRAKASGRPVANHPMRLRCGFRRGRAAGSDRPYRLVSHQYRRELLMGQTGESSLKLLD